MCENKKEATKDLMVERFDHQNDRDMVRVKPWELDDGLSLRFWQEYQITQVTQWQVSYCLHRDLCDNWVINSKIIDYENEEIK